MTINHVISGCEALFNTAIDSNFLKTYLIFLLLALPFLKTVASIIKTRKKINLLKEDCSNDLPKKLQKIIAKHGVSDEQILISCKTSLVAMATGLIDGKIIFSRSLIKKLS